MMTTRRSILKTVLTGVAASAVLPARSVFAAKQYKIAWSHYTGWEPIEYARFAGILKKWGTKYGVEIELLDPLKYVPSINLYTGGSVHGCLMTNMDALTMPAYGGVDSTALIIGDFSNGNDGVLGKKASSIKDLRGRSVKLVANSASHYLLARALAMNGMTERDLKKVENVDEDFLLAAFESDAQGITVTWNPLLMAGRNMPQSKLLFDSSQIPGEIIDMLVVRTDAPDALKRALTGAWYEVMDIMSGRGPRAQEALAYMAKVSGGTLAEFHAQLRTTAMFYKAAAAVDFATSTQIKETMEYVRTFSFEHGLFEGAPSKDYVGIQFSDKSVMGDTKNIKLRFDASYMQLAPDGKL